MQEQISMGYKIFVPELDFETKVETEVTDQSSMGDLETDSSGADLSQNLPVSFKLFLKTHHINLTQSDGGDKHEIVELLKENFCSSSKQNLLKYLNSDEDTKKICSQISKLFAKLENEGSRPSLQTAKTSATFNSDNVVYLDLRLKVLSEIISEITNEEIFNCLKEEINKLIEKHGDSLKKYQVSNNFIEKPSITSQEIDLQPSICYEKDIDYLLEIKKQLSAIQDSLSKINSNPVDTDEKTILPTDARQVIFDEVSRDIENLVRISGPNKKIISLKESTKLETIYESNEIEYIEQDDAESICDHIKQLHSITCRIDLIISSIIDRNKPNSLDVKDIDTEKNFHIDHMNAFSILKESEINIGSKLVDVENTLNQIKKQLIEIKNYSRRNLTRVQNWLPPIDNEGHDRANSSPQQISNAQAWLPASNSIIPDTSTPLNSNIKYNQTSYSSNA